MNAIDFECPECGARPGERCHTLTGKATPVSHAKRKRAAFEKEALRKDNGQGAVRIVTKESEKT
jgi:hypothetical protein